MDTKTSDEEIIRLFEKKAVELFDRIKEGEPWSDRITMDAGFWNAPHLAYDPNLKTGNIRMRLNKDERVMASWIAHEAGHMDCYEYMPPCNVRAKIESIIRSKRTPVFFQALFRKFLYIVFWRSRMREELCAHKAEIRLLQKIGINLEAINLADIEANKLVRNVPGSGILEKFFLKRMLKAQNKLTQTAINSSG